MTITPTYFGTPANQVQLQTSVLQGQMSKQERDQLEAEAVTQEGIFGTGNVFTIDSAGQGILPRNKRPTS